MGKTVGMMLGLGVLLGWGCVFLIPSVERLGMRHATANRLPWLGLVLGLLWGLGIRRAGSIRAASGYLIAPVLLGAVLWFFAVLLGGVLVGFGVSPEAADHVPLIGFVLGAALGSAPLVARGTEWIAARRER